MKYSESTHKKTILGALFLIVVAIVVGMWLIAGRSTQEPDSSPQPSQQAQDALLEYRDDALGFAFMYPERWGTATLKSYPAVDIRNTATEPYYQIVFQKDPSVAITIPNKNSEVRFKDLGRPEADGYGAYPFNFVKQADKKYCFDMPVQDAPCSPEQTPQEVYENTDEESISSPKDFEHNGVRIHQTHYRSAIGRYPVVQGFHAHNVFATSLKQGDRYQAFVAMAVFDATAPNYSSFSLEVIGPADADFTPYITQIEALMLTISKL